MSSNSAKASSKKKSQKSEKSEVEDASELRLREIAHEMGERYALKEQTCCVVLGHHKLSLALGILWTLFSTFTQGLFPDS